MFSAWFAGTRRVPLVAALACGVLIPRAETQTYRGRAAEQWIADLASGDLDQRWYAAHGLAQIGPGAAAAVGPLLAILADRANSSTPRPRLALAGSGPTGPGGPAGRDALLDLASVRRNPRGPWGGLAGGAAGRGRMIDADRGCRVSRGACRSVVARRAAPAALPCLPSRCVARRARHTGGRQARAACRAVAGSDCPAPGSGPTPRTGQPDRPPSAWRAGRGVLPHGGGPIRPARRTRPRRPWSDGPTGTAGLIAASATRRHSPPHGRRGLGRLGRARGGGAALPRGQRSDPTVRGGGRRQISSG